MFNPYPPFMSQTIYIHIIFGKMASLMGYRKLIVILLQVNDLLKVAKTNFVVLKLLAGGHKKDSRNPPDFSFAGHPHFPIIRLL
jgi:hypothetical protein